MANEKPGPKEGQEQHGNRQDSNPGNRDHGASESQESHAGKNQTGTRHDPPGVTKDRRE